MTSPMPTSAAPAVQSQPSAQAQTQQQIRDQVREQLRAQLDAQRAQLEAQRSQLEQVRIAQVTAQGSGGTVVVPPAPTTVTVDRQGNVVVRDVDGQATTIAGSEQPVRRGEQIPPEAVDIANNFMMTVGVVLLGMSAMRLLRAFVERRKTPPVTLAPEVTDRLDRIEQAVEAVAIEVERISEGQRFTSRLLAELRQAPQLAVPERVAEPRG